MGNTDILKANNEIQVLNAVERNLRQHNVKDYQIIKTLFNGYTDIQAGFDSRTKFQGGELCALILKNYITSHFTFYFHKSPVKYS